LRFEHTEFLGLEIAWRSLEVEVNEHLGTDTEKNSVEKFSQIVSVLQEEVGG
jgi:hypothetical protein